MLMVTTTVGMLHRVHSHTTHLGPAVPLSLVLVVGATSLQHRLVDPSSAGYDTDHSAVGAGDNLLSPRRQLDPCPLGVGVVGDDGGVVSAGPGYLSSFPSFLLVFADDGSLWH